MKINLLRIFGLAFLLNLLFFDISLAQDELDASSTVAELKVSNNTFLQEATAGKTSHRHDELSSSLEVQKTNLDNTSSSKEDAEARLISSERTHRDSKDDITNIQQENVTLTSVITSRSILIQQKGVSTEVPLVVDQVVPAITTTREELDKETNVNKEETSGIEIDEDVVKEVDNLDDMSKILGEQLPTKMVNGREEEISPSMEEIFDQDDDLLLTSDKKKSENKLGIIDEWIKQIEDGESVEIPTISVQEVPEVSVFTNEGRLQVVEVTQEGPKLEENQTHLEDSVNLSTNIVVDEETSTSHLIIEDKTFKTTTTEINLAESDIKSPEESVETINKFSSNVEDVSLSALIKTTTESTLDSTEEIISNKKDVEDLKIARPIMDDVKFTNGTTTEENTEIFTSAVKISEETTKISLDIMNTNEEVEGNVKLVDLVDEIKMEIKEEKEELEYFEGLVKATTIAPQVFTSKTTQLSKIDFEDKADEVSNGHDEFLKVVPLDDKFPDARTEANVATTEVVENGFQERLNNDLGMSAAAATQRTLEMDFGTSKNKNLMVPFINHEQESEIDIFVNGDKEVENNLTKNNSEDKRENVEVTTESFTDFSRNTLEFHHQTILSTTTLKSNLATTEQIIEKSKRPLSITEIVKEVLEAGEYKPTSTNGDFGTSEEVLEAISRIDYDYDLYSTKPSNDFSHSNKELSNQFAAHKDTPSVEAIDYGSSEEMFPPNDHFGKDFISKFPRIFNDDLSVEESHKNPVIVKAPSGEKSATTISYRSLIDGISSRALEDVITQAVMNGIEAVKLKIEEVQKEIANPSGEDYENDGEKKILDDVLVQKDSPSLKQLLSFEKDPIKDLSYDSAETDMEVQDIENDRGSNIIHRTLYFGEDLTNFLKVNFSMKITINNWDFFIPTDVTIQANNSESTVFMQLTWQSNYTSRNSLILKLDKGEDTLQIDGLFLDLHLTTLDGTVEHLQFARSWMNIVEWTRGAFEIKLGRGNVLHIDYLDLVLNEINQMNGVDSATFPETKLTSGTALLIIAVTFGSSLTAFAFGYLIYLKCRSKTNVFKIDLP